MVFAHFLNIFRFGQKSASKLYSVADYLFTSVATPMAFLVSIVFWVLFTIDRELVFPKVLDMVIPVWVNHSIHTFNSLIAIVDMALVNHKFSSWTSSLKGTFTYLALYAVCLYGTYFQTGIWLYPVLKEMDWPMRFAFSLSNLFIAVFMFALTKGVHKVFWGSVAPEKTKRSGKQKKK
ncbi:androgen-dependent TFPI-regulating protein-like [Cimex lectularius]|uniref:Androgen-dependent TFPI-regulating protein n=1 Tax=Cimex lectularius TaxID=79782 RepID=A0A8I6SRJ1_CIMLE|nr:androgen-dependent TFPI-regulating protein-like [Cimex lectularius]